MQLTGWVHQGLFMSLRATLLPPRVPIAQQAALDPGPRTIQTGGDCHLQTEKEREKSFLMRCLNKLLSLGPAMFISCDKIPNQSADPVAQCKCHMKLFFIQYQGQQRMTQCCSCAQVRWVQGHPCALVWKHPSAVNVLDIPSPWWLLLGCTITENPQLISPWMAPHHMAPNLSSVRTTDVQGPF